MVLVASSAVSVGILKKDPHPYPHVYVNGGEDQHLVSGPEGIEERISKNSTPEAVGRGHQGPRRGACPSKLRGGRGDLKPEQLLRLVTLLKKQ